MTSKLHNKSVILTSNCTTNNVLAKNLNNIINKKYKELDILKISVIVTAKYNKKNISEKELIKNAIKNFKLQEKKLNFNMPYEVTYIDCSKKKNLKKFEKNIKTTNIIWVIGGDTFFLWYHLKKTNMDKLICKRVKSNKVIYIGCCAGAIIAGETLNPTYVARFFKKSRKYNLKNTYKNEYWLNNKNKKTFKFFKNKDFLPHCRTKKSKTLNIYNSKVKMTCLPEYKLYTK